MTSIFYSQYNPSTSVSGVEGKSVVDLTSTSLATLFSKAADYNGSTIYTRGDLAYNQSSIWVYVNTTSGSGHAPPTLPVLANSYWEYVSSTSSNTYIWIAYANSINGTAFTDFTTDSANTGGVNRQWIGIASNRTSGVESTNPADYSWTRITDSMLWANISGIGKPEDNATVGAVTGTNLKSGVTGSTLTDGTIVTAQGISDGFSGQTEWATYSAFPPGAVTRPGINLIYDAGLTLQGQQWALEAWSWGQGADVGYFVYTTTSSSNMRVGGRVNVYPNDSYTFSVYCGGGFYTDSAILQLNWYNSSDTIISQVLGIGGAANTGYSRISITGVAPAGATYARCYIRSPSNITSPNGFFLAYKPKLELSAYPTVWTDDTTYGARYTTGGVIDNLKPAEIGANVTESRVAQGITGQSSWATWSSFPPETIGTKTQWLDATSGYLSDLDRIVGRRITKLQRDDGTTPITEGAIVTNLGTAAAIAYQGPLATAPSASPYTNANISIGANGALSGAGGGAVTIGGLGYTGALNATYGARVGVNLRNSADTAYLGDADVVTNYGTAAAIIGQSAWATSTIPLGKIAIRPNLFPYPNGVLDGRSTTDIGWSNTVSGGGWSTLGSGTALWTNGSYYNTYRTSGGPATDLYPYYDMEWTSGAGHDISVGLNGYAANGTFTPYIEFIGAAPAKAIISSFMLSYNSITDRWEGSGITPTNTAYIRVVLKGSFAATSSYQDLTFWSIKVEKGPYPTAMVDTSQTVITGNQVQWSTGGGLNTLKPAEIGANVTEWRTAAAITGQAWAATNGDQTTVSNAYVTGFANQAIDSEFTLGYTCWNEGYSTGGTWEWYYASWTSWKLLIRYNNSAVAGQEVNLGQTTTCGIPVWEGDRVECSAILAWENMNQAELYIGWYTPTGDYVGATLVSYGTKDTRVGGFATVPSGQNIGIAKVVVAMRVANNGYANARMAQPFIRRCSSTQTALSYYNPGPLHERGANVTETRVASAIAGQGAGATANNLAQLDATAAAQLTTAYNGGVMTVGYGETLKRRVADGSTINLTGYVACNAGGSTSGSIQARVQWRHYNDATWNNVATGTGSSCGPTEPGADEVSTTFTNGSGIEQLFEFRVIDVRIPGTAGGTIIYPQSYIVG